jgi:signal transduction histidine kinase
MLVEFLMAGLDRLQGLSSSRCETEIEERSRILEQERQRLQKLSQQVSLLDNMLRELRLLNEIERNPTEVDLNLLINSLLAAFRCDLFFKHKVQLELKLAHDPPLIRVLARHLMPTLVQLFQNAMIALREAPEKHLIIESRVEATKIWVSFRDSGCGLKPGEEQKCFELFYSGWSATVQEQERHFGVGLFLASALMEPYGVKVTLQREGRQTNAILEIPIKAYEAITS